MFFIKKKDIINKVSSQSKRNILLLFFFEILFDCLIGFKFIKGSEKTNVCKHNIWAYNFTYFFIKLQSIYFDIYIKYNID